MADLERGDSHVGIDGAKEGRTLERNEGLSDSSAYLFFNFH
jgi:hypothetical protein